ncbi:hypothetical protein CLV24_10787 [Pontibacter ummariensis]|uniref:Uncharacterized protein n=1 Tax=Pontibacter ummariensis TaxID=1610492 RepID=A0A239EWA8_9BACT|nr:hypothetical protein [Pontibacter ummariensis]PRY12716.1 hypothetical protein CLV24_10787 [Pontibacter ummariensis]SNS48905.1 hypothetical protein SAMN06296052_107101 [Pontibacter ummariensis]
MIKLSLLFLFLFVLQVTQADSAVFKVAELRNEYLEASKDEEAAKLFHKKMSAYKEKHPDPVVLAYKAASEAVMAKYVWNPYSKLKQLRTAEAIFQDAVALDKEHPEIRFLRFTVEQFVPRYLNLSKHVEEDKRVIIRRLKEHPDSGVSTAMARRIKDFMLMGENTTAEEKKVLRSIEI